MSRLDEAREILRAFGFDARRTNETAARTLLALAGIDEHTPWGRPPTSVWGSERSLTGCEDLLTNRLSA